VQNSGNNLSGIYPYNFIVNGSFITCISMSLT
jgi:hypothetical protein